MAVHAHGTAIDELLQVGLQAQRISLSSTFSIHWDEGLNGLTQLAQLRGLGFNFRFADNARVQPHFDLAIVDLAATCLTAGVELASLTTGSGLKGLILLVLRPFVLLVVAPKSHLERFIGLSGSLAVHGGYGGLAVGQIRVFAISAFSKLQQLLLIPLSLALPVHVKIREGLSSFCSRFQQLRLLGKPKLR